MATCHFHSPKGVPSVASFPRFLGKETVTGRDSDLSSSRWAGTGAALIADPFSKSLTQVFPEAPTGAAGRLQCACFRERLGETGLHEDGSWDFRPTAVQVIAPKLFYTCRL